MTETKTQTQLKSEAYNVAQTRLRTAHAAEYQGYVGEEMTKRGIEWTRRPTEQEKAEAQVADLLAKFPDLAGKFASAE